MRKIALALLLLSVLSSCRLLRPSLMLKTPKGYAYDQLNDSMAIDDYRISPTDNITFRLLSNEGFKLVDISGANLTTLSTFDASVENDGTVKLPLIGRVKLEGLTLREAEQMLETRFSDFYVGPYVIMRITNKRVTVFSGGAGNARVIPITNSRTTVFEALALAGGITEDGKAYKIKLIRKASPKPKVYLMDLSTIDGLKSGTIIVQANDIIYVEARNRVAQRITNEIVPYVTILSTVLLLYTVFKR